MYPPTRLKSQSSNNFCKIFNFINIDGEMVSEGGPDSS